MEQLQAASQTGQYLREVSREALRMVTSGANFKGHLSWNCKIWGQFKRRAPNSTSGRYKGLNQINLNLICRHINSFGDVEFFGCFVRGVVHGVCWRSLPGGGFLISPDHKFSGPSVTFLYPDCRWPPTKVLLVEKLALTPVVVSVTNISYGVS